MRQERAKMDFVLVLTFEERTYTDGSSDGRWKDEQNVKVYF